MEQNKDIVGDAVRGTYDAAMEKPRQAIKAVSDAASNAVSRVKSFLPGHGDSIATWNTNPTSAPKPSTPKPQPIAKPSGKMPSYKTGTDYVPHTGPAKLHKGEAVLDAKDAAKHRKEKMTKVNGMSGPMSGAAEELGGHSAAKPKKEIKHIVVKKDKGGKGHIFEHHHTAPEHHPMEEHISTGNDGMVDHMQEHMGMPNPGEPEADAGQSGMSQAPGMGSPTPAGGPTAGM